jgi:Cu-Zn family superoxide dismutase
MANSLSSSHQVAIDRRDMRISPVSTANGIDTMQHPIGTALGLAVLLTAWPPPARAADELTVTMHKATQDGISDTLGTISITVSGAGATLRLNLHGLPPGAHGFQVHENDNCSPTMMNGVRIPAGAAGGHLDPDNTGKHAGPTGDGHLGDLPQIEVASDGTAKGELSAPRIKDIQILHKHALIIHTGSDNYSDSPSQNGGEGGRIACGMIE